MHKCTCSELVAGWNESLPAIQIIDIASGRRLMTIRWPGAVKPGLPVAMAFSGDGQRLLVARERTCLSWVIRNGYAAQRPPQVPEGEPGPELGALYRAIGLRIAVEGPLTGDVVNFDLEN